MGDSGQKPAALRGSETTRVDDKGRLKIPSIFRSRIHARSGADVFVTSVKGDSVLVYPIDVWSEMEERILKAPTQTPALKRFMELNAQLIALSRRNTNVHSLMLSLDEKRKMTLACQDNLRQLQAALAKRGYSGIRQR